MPKARLEGYRDPPPEVVHAYRDIKTGLAFYGEKHLLRSLLVTSSRPEEGKTTTVANLASGFAQSGIRTLILEVDLWRPKLRTIFGLGEAPGLVELVRGEAELGEVLVEIESPRLSLIPAGLIPPHPEEIFASERMTELLEQTAREFDLVLIDGPPLSASLEVAALGRMADGVAYVVRAGSTPRPAARKGVERLRQLGCNLVGVILTAVEPTSDGLAAYSYYEYRRYREVAGESKARPTAAL